MIRQSVTRPLTTTSRAVLTRPFSAVAPRMAAGDTGATRPGGIQTRYVPYILILFNVTVLNRGSHAYLSSRPFVPEAHDVISLAATETAKEQRLTDHATATHSRSAKLPKKVSTFTKKRRKST
jgi:hypothetical protein